MADPVSRVDLNLLVVLEALLELGSTRAAARRLGVTQPAISYSLRKLRTHFGDELFRRTQTGLAPTAFAQTLAEPVQRALATVRHEILSASPFDPAETQRRFNIASSEIGELLLLPPLLDAMRQEAPNAALNWLPIPARSIEDSMAEGAIDILISGTIENADERQFYQQRLYTHEYVGLIASTHPLAGEMPQAMRRLPAYLMTSSPATRGRIGPLLEQAGIALSRDLATTRLLSFPFVLQRADAFAVAPKAVATMAARFAPLTAFPLDFDLPRIEVKQFWHRRFHADPASIWLRQMIARIFMNNDPTPEA